MATDSQPHPASYEELARENQGLRCRIEQLEKENRNLKDLLEQARRGSKRQAAPFARGTSSSNVGSPSRG